MHFVPRTMTRALCVLALLAGGAACGSGSGSTTSPTATPAASSAQLIPAPTGTVTLSWSATTRVVTADLDVYGFALSSQHALRLVAGGCDSSGQTVTPFPDLKTDGYGAFKGPLAATQRISGIPPASHLEVLLGPAAQAGTAPGSTRLACGAVNTNTAAPIILNEPAATPSSGTVSLSYIASSKSVVVHVVATGLAPSSMHAVHIHFGSCRQQSGVLYTVGDVTSNGSGAVDATKTIANVSFPPPAHGWYADIHDGSTALLETGGQPTLLFAPILCGDHA